MSASFLRSILFQLRRIFHLPARDFAYLTHPLFNRDTTSTGIAQKQLLAQYAQLKQPLPINQVGFRCFSQFDEDGILLYIFSQIGFGQKIGIEIGADCSGDYFAFPESNLTNLLVYHGWQGLLIDADAAHVRQLQRFFRNCKSITYRPPQIVQATVTRDTINQLIEKAGLSGEIDLFSLDTDGNDYWLFQALEVVRPRVLVLEFNHFWQGRAAVTIPYQEDLAAFGRLCQHHPEYFGASLAAMVKLADKKGYRLVALNSFGHNAFFVRKDLGRRVFKKMEIPVQSKANVRQKKITLPLQKV